MVLISWAISPPSTVWVALLARKSSRAFTQLVSMWLATSMSKKSLKDLCSKINSFVKTYNNSILHLRPIAKKSILYVTIKLEIFFSYFLFFFYFFGPIAIVLIFAIRPRKKSHVSSHPTYLTFYPRFPQTKCEGRRVLFYLLYIMYVSCKATNPF